MTEENDTPATREELVEARESIRAQIATLEYPLRSQDKNPVLIAKLRGMLTEIEEALASTPPG